MCQIALSKICEKVKKRKEKKKIFWEVCVFFLTTLNTNIDVFNFFLNLNTLWDFWKEQFDKFDTRCDVLRVEFCNSRNIFLETLQDLSN